MLEIKSNLLFFVRRVKKKIQKSEKHHLERERRGVSKSELELELEFKLELEKKNLSILIGQDTSPGQFLLGMLDS
jgi:hypothetical protein